MNLSFILRLALLFLFLTCLKLDDAPSAYAANRLPEVVLASGTAYYVRADGGNAQQCTGLVDAPYPGSGTNQPCAWDHPFRALPPGEAPRIAGGDTLIIGAGEYRMGDRAPGADHCYAAGSFDCIMPPIPSGPDAAHPTRILGAGWDSGCSNPPQLWGAERPWFIVNLTDSSNVELACLEITDHSSCVENHAADELRCMRDSAPFGDWASYGLYAEDSTNVSLRDLNIHGLASGGVHAGRLTDWTVERVRIVGNGFVGWDGDLWGAEGDSNSGNLLFRHLTVEWNGCGETYPGGNPSGCWAQSAGGYGDGFATGASGGHWVVEDSFIRWNTSDGLDFLYISEPGSSIEIRRTVAEGNAGNQVKVNRGPFLIENSVIVGNCGFFDGQPFTYNVDNCRAAGVALAIGLTRGDQAVVVNNTLTSEGDCLVTAECSGGGCDGSERVLLRNNIFQGQVDFLQPFENTCLVYQETFPANPFDVDDSIINQVKHNLCPGAHDLCGIPPGLADASIDAFNPELLAGSPAIDIIDAGDDDAYCPSTDLLGAPRPQGAGCDIGAYEFTQADPFVAYIRRADPDPTASATVDFTVTFTEPVTGVTLDNFTLTTTGVSDATVSGLAGSGASYTLTVNTGSGDGTIRLDLLDNDTILDADLNPLGGAGNGVFTRGKIYEILKSNVAPTNITLSNHRVTENQPGGALVGLLTTADRNPGETFTYTFCGGTDDASFQFSGAQLQSNTIFDYETKSGYSVCIRATDSRGLHIDETFAIAVTNANDLPGDITLSNNAITENRPIGSRIGALTTTDPDAGDTHTYSFCGGADDASFALAGDALNTMAVFDYEMQASYNTCIRTSDGNGGTFEKPFTITVTDAPPPTVVSITRANPNATSAASVNFTVTFSDTVTAVDRNDFTLSIGGSITGASVASVTPINGSTYRVTVNTGAGTGTLRLDIPAGISIVDTDNKPLSGLPYTSGDFYVVRPQTFNDVPMAYWAWNFIERLYLAGITGGCSTSPLMYCPEANVTRAQMAIFLLRSKYGAEYTPPPATGAIFGDIPAGHWAAAWIEQLAAEGITGGCSGGNYCPDTPITRDQMAVFLLRAIHGNAYNPPAANGDFADVPVDYWAATWIEQLAAEGITGGCGNGNYCPTLVVTRAQMAVFLSAAFGAP
ncbi:MAG: S-layer homology domain-containing protein [Chloroflexota bacterium]